MARWNNRKKPHSTTELIDEVAREFKLKGLAGRHPLFARWEKIVGRRLAEVCQPTEIKGKVLTVRVVDSVWGQDIKADAAAILEKIVEVTGDQRLTGLRVVTGRLTPPLKAPEPRPPLEISQAQTRAADKKLRRSKLADREDQRHLLARIWAKGRQIAEADRERKS